MDKVALAIILLALLVLAGKLIKIRLKFLSEMFIPSSVLGGVLAILFGPFILGGLFSEEHWLSNGLFTKDILNIWKDLPGLLINVVFACLMLGKEIPPLKKIWKMAGPQAAFGQSLAWGQYVIGSLLVIFILVPFFGANPMSAALIEIGFQGGHGTAAGLGKTFNQLSFSEGKDLALGLATIGVVGGILFGTFFINWAVHSKKVKISRENLGNNSDDISNIHRNEENINSLTGSQTSDPLSSQIGLIGLAILIGWGLYQGLLWIETSTWGANDKLKIIEYMPLFPLSMVGGLLLQLLLKAINLEKLTNRTLINRTSGVALDIIIVSALATLSLDVLGSNFWTLFILALGGICWNIFAFFVIAPRIFTKQWVERGVGDFGQSMGMTVTGLLLLRIADPQGETKAVEGFSYKQLLFEPIVGGGVFTSLSLPLIYNLGIYPFLGIVTVLLIIFLSLGLFYFGHK